MKAVIQAFYNKPAIFLGVIQTTCAALIVPPDFLSEGVKIILGVVIAVSAFLTHALTDAPKYEVEEAVLPKARKRVKPERGEAEMGLLVRVVIALVVAAVIVWLLGYAIPYGIAALVALAVFLILVFRPPAVLR